MQSTSGSVRRSVFSVRYVELIDDEVEGIYKFPPTGRRRACTQLEADLNSLRPRVFLFVYSDVYVSSFWQLLIPSVNSLLCKDLNLVLISPT